MMNSYFGLRNGTNGHQQSSQSSKMGLLSANSRLECADIVVLDTFHDDPIVTSSKQSITMFVLPSFKASQDVDIMTAINQDDWEPITGGGVSKVVDVHH